MNMPTGLIGPEPADSAAASALAATHARIEDEIRAFSKTMVDIENEVEGRRSDCRMALIARITEIMASHKAANSGQDSHPYFQPGQ